MYHTLGMELGDNTLKIYKNHQVFLATLSWVCENRSQFVFEMKSQSTYQLQYLYSAQTLCHQALGYLDQ